MSHAVRVHETGDASVMKWEEVNVADPAAGEVCLRHTAIGLNFIDIYFRAGTYPSPQLPFIPGLEAAGVIESIGENISGFDHEVDKQLGAHREDQQGEQAAQMFAA